MYSRALNGKTLTFGVSGKLWKNALVMYDRETRTLWSHLTGEALSGPLSGQTLEMVSSPPRIAWKDWKGQYPESLVLSVGSNEDLKRDVYEGYHASQKTGLFEPGLIDNRVGNKELVIGVRLESHRKAYPLRKSFWEGIGNGRLIQDSIGNVPVLIYHNPESYFTVVYDRRQGKDLQYEFKEQPTGIFAKDSNGELWNLLTGEGPSGIVLHFIPHVNIYWFAWVDFYPETILYTP